jgi:hypothetical protein
VCVKVDSYGVEAGTDNPSPSWGVCRQQYLVVDANDWRRCQGKCAVGGEVAR